MSLMDLLKNLSVLENEIDDSPEISPEMCHEHFKSLIEIDVKVDRLLEYMDACKMRSVQNDSKAEEFKNAAKKWERRFESLKNYCLYIIKSTPHISYRGTNKQMGLKLNAPSLQCPMRVSFSSSNIIPADFVEVVPEKYREAKLVWVLRTDVVRDDLKAGIELPFASLERKESLQIKLREV